MKKLFKSGISVITAIISSIITVVVEFILTKLFELKTLKGILLLTFVVLIVSICLYIPLSNLMYRIEKVIRLFIKNRCDKNTFEKYYNIVCELYNNDDYQDKRIILKLNDCVDYIFNLFLDKTENSLNDEIQRNLIENITYICIKDYLEKCKKISYEFYENNSDATEIILKLNDEINNVEARLILLGY